MKYRIYKFSHNSFPEVVLASMNTAIGELRYELSCYDHGGYGGDAFEELARTGKITQVFSENDVQEDWLDYIPYGDIDEYLSDIISKMDARGCVDSDCTGLV